MNPICPKCGSAEVKLVQIRLHRCKQCGEYFYIPREVTSPNEAEKERPKRQHLIQSAGYWFNAAMEARASGAFSEAMCCMEQAYNHAENAYASLTFKLAEMEKERDTLKAKMAVLARAVDIAEQMNDAQTDQQAALSASFNESMAHILLEQAEKERDELRIELSSLRQELEKMRGEG